MLLWCLNLPRIHELNQFSYTVSSACAYVRASVQTNLLSQTVYICIAYV